MSAPVAAEPVLQQRPRTRHVRALLAYLFVAALGVAGLWLWPSDGLGRDIRTMVTQSVAFLTALVLLVWWGLYSGLSPRLRLAVPVLVLGTAAASVRSVGCTGDMRLLLTFRWEPSHYDALEAERRAQRESGGETELTLAAESPADYPEYRNRARDGVARGPALARDWKARPPRLVWKQLCGGGYAGFAVGRGRAVTVEQRRGDEVVACYDAASGRELWTHAYPARFYDPRGGEGPMATPNLAGDEVYSLGGTGRLVCLDLARGTLKWEADVLKDNGATNLTWGMAGSPLVYGGVVVVNPGSQGGGGARALAAYDRKSGKRVWAAGNTRAGYSSPMRVTLAGVRQVVLLDGQEVAGYGEDGEGKLWSLDYPTEYGINVAQPLAVGDDRLFVTAAYGTGCGLLRVRHEGDKWSAAQDGYWRKKTMRCKFTSPVLFQGLVYGLDEGVLACVDPADGRQLWKGKRYGHGQLLRSDDLLLIQAESGDLVLAEAAGERTRELGRFRALGGDKTWNCPVLAGGRAYVRNHVEMACYDLAEGRQ